MVGWLVLKTRNQRQVQKLRNLHRRIPLIFLTRTILGVIMAGVTMDGMMTGARLDGTKVGNKTYDTSASSFALGSFDFGAMSSPKRFEWVKMNLDTGAAVNTLPLNFGPDGAGDGRFCRTASGEWIPDGGAWQFQGYDENGLLRSLNGRLTSAHKKVCSSGEIAFKGRQHFYFGSDSGFMIPVRSKIGHEMRMHFARLVSWHGRMQIITVNIEDNLFNFFMSKEAKSTDTTVVNNSQQPGNEYGRAVHS